MSDWNKFQLAKVERHNEVLTYPVILTEYNDESGHYCVVTSPNVKGMVTDGKTIAEALKHSVDAIATMIFDSEAPEYKIRGGGNWKQSSK